MSRSHLANGERIVMHLMDVTGGSPFCGRMACILCGVQSDHCGMRSKAQRHFGMKVGMDPSYECVLFCGKLPGV